MEKHSQYGKKNNYKRYFKVMSKHITYTYLNDLYNNKKRIVVTRYGDGEYFIIKGIIKKRNRIAKQYVTNELIISLSKAIQTEGQLICFPCKIKITPDNLYILDNDKLSNNLTKYLINLSHHSLYGQGQWRMIDILRYDSAFITNFFMEKTLIVTGHREATYNAFKKMNNINIYEVPIDNAFKEYHIINKDLIKICNQYKNIIFGCGPLSKILISNLIKLCDTNLIDLGSVIGIIINPFGINSVPVNLWSGFGKKGNKDIIKKCSDNFFKTLKKKK